MDPPAALGSPLTAPSAGLVALGVLAAFLSVAAQGPIDWIVGLVLFLVFWALAVVWELIHARILTR